MTVSEVTPEAGPVMLSTVRVAAGLTQSELVREVGMSQGLLSKAEAGMVELDDERWRRLADRLDAPVRLLRLPIGSVIEPATVFHRKRSTLQVSDANRLRAQLDLIQLQVKGILGSLPVQIGRIDLPDDGWTTPREVAEQVRETLGVAPGPVPNLIRLLEAAGIAVLRRDLGTTRLDALMSWPRGGRPVVLLGHHAAGDRQRFTVAHELGHAVMHQIPRENQETEADEFASQLLMPREMIEKELGHISIARLAQLKARWGTSRAALLRRAHDLGQVSDSVYRGINVEFSQAGYRSSEPVDIPIDDPQLVTGCVRERLKAGEAPSDLAAAAWMTPDTFSHVYMDKEMVDQDDRVLA
jgi:Zn-dependent peptidase ImmA (M78 family)